MRVGCKPSPCCMLCWGDWHNLTKGNIMDRHGLLCGPLHGCVLQIVGKRFDRLFTKLPWAYPKSHMSCPLGLWRCVARKTTLSCCCCHKDVSQGASRHDEHDHRFQPQQTRCTKIVLRITLSSKPLIFLLIFCFILRFIWDFYNPNLTQLWILSSYLKSGLYSNR